MAGTAAKRPMLVKLWLWLLVEWTACPPKKDQAQQAKKTIATTS